MSILTNKMEATINLLPPPIKTITVPIVKDSMLDSSRSVINFGKIMQLITTDVSEDKKYRSIIGTDTIPIIDHTDWSNLIRVRLTLYVARYLTDGGEIGLYITKNNKWTETGVTWANQPTDLEFVTSKSMAATDKSISFDLTNYFTTNPSGEIINFVLMSESNVYTNIPLTFGSRESDYPPILEFAWKYYNSNALVYDIPITITTLAQTIEDIPITFEVDSDIAAKNIPITFTVPNDKEYLDIPITFSCSNDIQVDIPITFTVPPNEEYLDIPITFESIKDTKLDIPITFESIKDIKLDIPITFNVQLDKEYLDIPITFESISVSNTNTPITFTVVRPTLTKTFYDLEISFTSIPPTPLSFDIPITFTAVQLSVADIPIEISVIEESITYIPIEFEALQLSVDDIPITFTVILGDNSYIFII